MMNAFSAFFFDVHLYYVYGWTFSLLCQLRWHVACISSESEAQGTCMTVIIRCEYENVK